jgi:hypothetical protein
MTVFIAVISTVSAGATLVAVWLAWRSARASATATEAARKTAGYARDAVEIAAAAREADERWRQRQQLQEIGQLAQQIRFAAAKSAIKGAGDGWGCGDQDQLGVALVGVRPELPQCWMLSQARGAATVVAAAIGAEMEVRAAFRKLEDQWAAERKRTVFSAES